MTAARRASQATGTTIATSTVTAGSKAWLGTGTTIATSTATTGGRAWLGTEIMMATEIVALEVDRARLPAVKLRGPGLVDKASG
jgi:hypothetical protein